MGRINVLDFEIANLIAAGEVVERPSSVMKELIENSIDSGATKITAEIKKGGVALIRVSDNGSGIEKEDLPVAIKRHATSKIRTKDDLSTIMTLGFRGEALAAISSVSEMTIITKTKNAESGSMLTSEAGRVVDVAEVGAADGTTVVVENLFYNVPARRKFLKKDSTEAMNVAALVEKVALSRPDISIQLLIDGEERFKTPGDGDLYNTVYAVLGKDFAGKLIEADGTAGGIRVHGFIGRSDNARRNRNLQNVFINGRYVKSLTAMAAIEKAYTSYIAPECFPSCVLFLEMSPGIVDVNVHPAKLEVKFSDERTVFEAIYYTVKSALEAHEYRPEMELGAKKKQSPLTAFLPIEDKENRTRAEQVKMNVPAERGSEVFQTPKPTYKAPANESVWNKPLKVSSPKPDLNPSSEKTPRESIELLERFRAARPAEAAGEIKTPAATLQENKKETAAEKSTRDIAPSSECPQYRIAGEVFDCYVLVELDGALLVIDKHAAHERIIFEELKKKCLSGSGVVSQTLLLPLTAILSPASESAAREYASDLHSVGFDFTVRDGAADITAIPEDVSPFDAEGLFVRMVDELAEGRGNPKLTDEIRRERALYQIACKAAIKGGRYYNDAIIKWLVEKVLALPDVTVCPHGRPIAYKLTKNELDRQFDRIK
ncbi:MAG: DNA mismatch repair endonuclease MutL [Clostridia bacterium]|nr:DNA mismatch repair endonuclease MutL [Clostridia bacterium]